MSKSEKQAPARARGNWIPWIVATALVVTTLFWLAALGIVIYRRNTGYYERIKQRGYSPRSKVTVSDAVNETFSSDEFGENTKFAYPEISIRNKNTVRANEKISKAIAKYNKGSRKGKYTAQYSYYINKNVVSIVVEVRRLSESQISNYYVYNISAKNGRLLGDSDLLREYGVSEEAFYKKAKSIYNSYFKTGDSTDNENESTVSPYIGENGRLCFEIDIEIEDGKRDSALFDFKAKEPLKGPIDSK